MRNEGWRLLPWAGFWGTPTKKGSLLGQFTARDGTRP